MNRPKIGIGTVVKREGKVLLGLRKNSHDEGTWAFPGGHLEFGESPLETAVRETKEETGLSVLNPTLVSTTNDVFKKESKHYITLFVEVDSPEGDAKICEPDNCHRWEWFKCISRDLI